MTAAHHEVARKFEPDSSFLRNQAEAQRPVQVMDYASHCRVCRGARRISEEVMENGPLHFYVSCFERHATDLDVATTRMSDLASVNRLVVDVCSFQKDLKMSWVKVLTVTDNGYVELGGE